MLQLWMQQSTASSGAYDLDHWGDTLWSSKVMCVFLSLRPLCTA